MAAMMSLRLRLLMFLFAHFARNLPNIIKGVIASKLYGVGVMLSEIVKHKKEAV
jgi:hypothetical protein